jgi:D-alanine-D-alanine ligase
MNRMKRLLIVSDYLAEDGASLGPDDIDTIRQAQRIRLALETLGFATDLVRFRGDILALKNTLLDSRPDILFNMAEGDFAPQVALLAAALQVPYTGGDARSLLSTTNKLWTKAIARRHGIPTATWYCLDDLQQLPREFRLGGCYIAKAASLDGSMGLGDDAVMETPRRGQLLERLDRLAARHGVPFFAEEFLPGREFKISIIETQDELPRILPLREIAFKDGGPGYLHYAAQWDNAHPDQRFLATRFVACGCSEISEHKKMALDLWNLFGVQGYARVDLKEDARGRPHLLELNVNPGLSPDAGFTESWLTTGRSYEEMIVTILDSAVERHVHQRADA